MNIRKSNAEDLPKLLEVYEKARQFMRETGNPNQWITNPTKEKILADIEREVGYVVEENGEIVAGFAFLLGEDPTYAVIEDGRWLNENPYGTIHRIGSTGTVHGILHRVLLFVLSENPSIKDIRIDTHKDNLVMQHLLEKEGFSRCGIIYVRDDLSDRSPRIAYQKNFSDSSDIDY